MIEVLHVQVESTDLPAYKYFIHSFKSFATAAYRKFRTGTSGSAIHGNYPKFVQIARMNKRILFCLFIILSACNHNPYKESNKLYKDQTKDAAKLIRQKPPDYFGYTDSPWIGTVNFDLRRPNFVIIHHTAQTGCPATLHSFTITQSQVSAHYVICKDGTVHHLLNDYLRAWHAGQSKWGNNSDINSSSIGIELDNDGFEPFTEPQIRSLLVLLDTIKIRYKIPQENFIGHGDIAPGRKVDPNWRFPLEDAG